MKMITVQGGGVVACDWVGTVRWGVGGVTWLGRG